MFVKFYMRISLVKSDNTAYEGSKLERVIEASKERPHLNLLFKNLESKFKVW